MSEPRILTPVSFTGPGENQLDLRPVNTINEGVVEPEVIEAPKEILTSSTEPHVREKLQLVADGKKKSPTPGSRTPSAEATQENLPVSPAPFPLSVNPIESPSESNQGSGVEITTQTARPLEKSTTKILPPPKMKPTVVPPVTQNK